MVEEVLRTCNSHDVVYEWTMSTFRKTSRLPIPMIKMDGTPFVWARSWLEIHPSLTIFHLAYARHSDTTAKES